MSSSTDSRFVSFIYRYRFLLAILSVAAVLAAFAGGINRMMGFSARVTALDDPPVADAPPRMFDPRTDIWFDPEDSGIRGYYMIEDQFIGEDMISIAFEDTEDPWGAFGVESLQTIARLTHEIERIPNVRNVRSLTTNPWIRWGDVGDGEEGLIIGDLFADPAESYSEDERLERMIAVLGAERAAGVAGESRVRALLGQDADFSEYIGEPRLLGAVVSDDGRSTALLVQILRPRAEPELIERAFGDDEAEAGIGVTIRVMERQSATLSAIEEVLAEESGVEFHLAGLPLFEREFMRIGMADMKFIMAMFVAIGLVLFVIYRKKAAVFVPLLVVFAAILGMNGAVWLKGDLMNNLTAIAPVMITAIGIADAVHLVTAYYLLAPQHTHRDDLIRAVLRKNALPVFLTSITTAVGFFSLTVSDLFPIQSLGYTAGIGTLIAYVLSMTIVPAILSLLPMPKRAEGTPAKPAKGSLSARLARLSGPWMKWVLSRRRGILIGSVLILIISGIGLANIRINSDMRMMFPEDRPIIQDLYWTEARIGGGSDLDIVFQGPEDSRIASSAAFLGTVDAFQRRVEEEAENPDSPLRVLTNFDSGLAVLRKMHQVQNENRAQYYRVPREDDVPAEAREPMVLYDDILEEEFIIPGQDASTLIAQYYIQFENGAQPSENLRPLVTQDRRGFRIAARTTTESNEVLLAAFARLREILNTEFPQIAGSEEQVANGEATATVMFSGKQYLFTNMMQSFSSTLMTSLALALTLITLLIGIVFRSATLALISLIPNVLPLVIPLGIMGLLGMPLDGPAVLVVTVALGVCVDDTIHFLTKFTEGRRAGLPIDEVLRRTFEQVGAAVTWTTIILVVGFTVLSFASFRPNMLIGALGAIMIALAWVADFVVTPALLSYFGRDTTSNVATEAA